ncbi:maltase-glucoamylase, intestinal-like [Lacerta agilis]|uniref:maltase-glucoamylase, intestinal-like n=1 Tax=Lacerta agilis TaxID=80427 RepID=UPI001419A97E|nr:maltase-glucoamylase, intestinal-like [Lacerta agilis]
MERNKKFHFLALALAVLSQACTAREDGLYGYSLTGKPEKTEKGWRVALSRRGIASLYENDIPQLALDVEFQTEDRVRFKIYDPNNQRFEVPLKIESPPLAAADTSYDIEFANDLSLRFKIIRKATGTVLWDTSLADLVFSQQYLRISTNVPSSSVYGFGEHQHPSFKHNMNHITYGMYSRDQSPKMNANLYGVHPFYMCIENDANAHGVLFLNSNAQDVTLHPDPSLTFRTIGGVLDFYVFLGPTPENVIQQYTEAIGRPHLPPYWSLGYQLSRWGYPDIGAVEQVVKRMTQYGIPYDVQYGDIDYMDRKLDFTYDKEKYAGLPEFMQELKKDGLHYVIVLDPFLSKDQARGSYQPYELGERLGIWVKNSDGVTPAVGQALAPGNSVYPDFFNPKTADWWTQMCVQFHNVLPYDGIWMDMNEPSNFLNGQIPGCAHNNLNNPPYIPRISDSSLFQNTLCPDSKTFLGDLYDTHSLFGWSEAPPTFQAIKEATGKRPFVLSRSTFVGNGKYTAHWLGDNHALWEDMHTSIIGILEFNLFGIPQVGADICGFYYDTTFELCLRWTQLGAFYPLSRNHNAIGQKEQDPGVFGLEFATIARSTLQIRYSLLPYLYTLFFEAHAFGNTVARGLMHEFPADPQTHEIDTAFLWGSAFMIAPVLQEGARSVDVYFPEAPWFDYYTGDKVPDSSHRKRVKVNAPLEKIPLFIRGGYILPTQAPAVRTAKSRLNPFGLIVALDEQGQAAGSLFWDDGDSADTVENGNYFYARYTYREGHLKTSIVNNNYRGVDSLIYDTVQILGVASRPNAVVMNGKGIRRSDIHYQENGKLVVHLSVPLGEELDLILQ